MSIRNKAEKVLKLFFRSTIHLLPAKKNHIYIYNILDGYNDSVKYITLELHRRHPEYLYIWEFPTSVRNKELPKWIVQVKSGTFRAYYYQTRAILVLDSYIGLRCKYCKDNRSARITRRYFRLLKCKSQINISTFHGSPFKYLGADRADKSFHKSEFVTSCDYFVCGNELECNVYSRVYASDYQIIMLGKANTDPLFIKDENHVLELKQKLQLPTSKKIILYAPTYRDWSLEKGGLNQMEQLNIPAILLALSQRFGGEWVFGLRVHHYVLDYIRRNGFLDKYDGVIYDCNRYDDMAEYMACCDAIISDYSSLLVDALQTSKPCFILANDYEEYKLKRGGLYLDLELFPTGVQYDNDELINAINSYDDEKADMIRKDLLLKMGNINDGFASKRIVDFIENLF